MSLARISSMPRACAAAGGLLIALLASSCGARHEGQPAPDTRSPASTATRDRGTLAFRQRPATIAATISTGAGSGPSGIAIGADAIWVTAHRAGAVLRIDPATDRIVARIAIPRSAGHLEPPPVVLREGVIVCVLDGANRLVRIDPATDEVTEARVPCESIGDGPLGTWVAAGGRVAQIDPASLQTIRVLRPPDLPGDADAAIAQAGGSLWVSRAGADSGGLFRVDPRSGQVVAHWTFTAANYTLAASAQTVYFTDPIADSVTAIDVATNQIERTAPVPGSDEGDPLLTYVDGQLWASTLTGGLALLDPASLRVIGTAQIDSQDYVGEVAVAGRYVWYPTYGGDAVVKVRRAALESD